MDIPFTKYHGLQNDYLFIDELHGRFIPESILADLAVSMSHRRNGVGADGIVLIQAADGSHAAMRIFNADGSEAETCGNALRCIARHLVEVHHVTENPIQIDTAGGTVSAQLIFQNQELVQVVVNMGRPDWQRDRIPVTGIGDGRNVQLEIDGMEISGQCLSMGNPHCVIFLDELNETLVRSIGPRIESHPLFPQRINTEFCRIISRAKIEMMVWERGSGFTLACGSGASAAFAAARDRNLVNDSAEIHLPGGVLFFKESTHGDILMRGPAERVFHGVFPYAPTTR